MAEAKSKSSGDLGKCPQVFDPLNFLAEVTSTFPRPEIQRNKVAEIYAKV
jgi:hypothetical protein